jgi:6-phosphogluconate dehydrogenase (decarboxylating)
MQIGIVGLGRVGGNRVRRLATMRTGFGGHAVAAKVPQP